MPSQTSTLRTHVPLVLAQLFMATTAMGLTAPVTARSAPVAVTALPGTAIAPYVTRFGRTKPVIAVIGENSGTELSDFVIPYGVLTQSGAADVVAVATRDGPMQMTPAARIQPQATIADFDARFPNGADYVIVPAMTKSQDPVLLAWLAAQAARGATIVSICDGAVVVANAGLMKDRTATAHWASQGYRKSHHPEVHWVKNVRYVADGKIVSSAGISAAMPTALALVEAIAGHDAAVAEAKTLSVGDWSRSHNSEVFEPHFGVNLLPLIAVNFTNARFHKPQTIGVPIHAGSDEIALAFTADAWSRTGLSHPVTVSASMQPVVTRGGLTILPDRTTGESVDYALPSLDGVADGRAIDVALAGIAGRFGRGTAYGTALDLEYPDFHK